MYITPESNIQFKGYTRFLSCNSEGKAKRLSDCPFGTASFGDTRGMSALVKKHSYPNAGVEETIGKLHDNITCRVYVADPGEVVNDLIKLQHDYIVYDYEPDYPNIRENYYQENINKGFQNVKEYLQRLESVELRSASGTEKDKKVLQQRLKKLHTRLKVVDECSKIYDEGAELREKKSALERKMDARKFRIAEMEAVLPKYSKELERKRTAVINQQEVLPKKENTLNCLLERMAKLREKTNRTPEEVALVEQRIRQAENALATLKKHMEKNIKRVEFLEDYIAKAPEKLVQYRREQNQFAAQLEEINHAIEPYIKKLCSFYTQNGIKIIKRM